MKSETSASECNAVNRSEYAHRREPLAAEGGQSESAPPAPTSPKLRTDETRRVDAALPSLPSSPPASDGGAISFGAQSRRCSSHIESISGSSPHASK